MKNRISISVLILVFIPIYFFNIISAQYKSPRKYVITHWGLDEGLPQSSVNDLLQSKDGYIWLATFGGLVRFDGVEFTVFDRSNAPGMISDRCVTLFEDRNGIIWIVTERGLVRKENNNGFWSYETNRSEGKDFSGKLYQDKSGTLWIVNSDIHRFDNGNLITYYISDDEALRRRALNGEGDFWFIFNNRVVRLIDGKFIMCIDMTKYSRYAAWSVKETAPGTLWITTNGSGIFRFINGTIKQFTLRNGLASNNLQHLLVDNDGILWANGTGGISRFNGEEIESLYRHDGLSDGSVNTFIQDHEGNYWAGTFSRGLNKIQPVSITTLDKDQGLREERVLSLSPSKNGQLIIGTNGGGEFLLNNGIITRPKFPLQNDRSFVWSIFEDSRGRIWGADGKRLFFQENGRKTEIQGFPGNFLTAIFEDRSGAMWFGSTNGLNKFTDGKFIEYTTREGLSSNDVRSIFEDRHGTLWIGTTSGLNKLRNGKIESFTNIHDVTSHYIRFIHQDKDGILWFGTYGGGVIRLKDEIFTVYTTIDGMFDNIVSHIVEDDSGYFWMGSNRGIARVSRNELNAYERGKSDPLHVVTFGKLEGMKTIETNGGFQPSAVKDVSGKIYFPTVEGVAVVDPKKVFINKSPPAIHIEKFLIEGSQSEMNRSDIPYDSANIEIRYTALSFTNPSKVRFKYKIEGYNSDWIDVGTRRTAYFTKMPPGEYTFRVIASNNDGYWNMEGASVSFTILPPFWMTWWFRTLMTFLFIGGTVFVVRFNEQKKIREKIRAMEKAAAVERERLRIARDLHDELGARLTEIGLMTDVAMKEKKKKETSEQLENIGSTARGIVESFREIVWAVNPQQDTLDGLIDFLEQYVQRFLKRAGIRCRLHIATDIPVISFTSDQRHGIFMAVKESLNNVVKHSRATEVKFTARIEESSIVLIIEDNGRGFSDSEVSQFSNGLANMKQRLKDVNGSAEISSVLKKGTTVTFNVTVGRNKIK